MSATGPRLRFLRPFTLRVVNPMTRRFADRRPGFAIVSYRGRTSGKLYRTPMNVFHSGAGYVFALTYGSDVQWVKNVLAAGSAEITTGGRVIRLVEPAVFVDRDRRAVPTIVGLFLRLLNVDSCEWQGFFLQERGNHR